MASSALPKLLLLCFFLICFCCTYSNPLLEAHLDKTSMGLISEALEWPTTMSFLEEFDGDDQGGEEDGSGVMSRRSLFWRRMRYYISYGALAANRVPCPPRSGRSYYTHNCYRARGPVHPYSRGCSSITRCRR